ncbi:DUF2993 domain-containing protein [Streptomyces sp. NPDC049906]|uniref:LmeA family phospholipid-binding protein n=1 Tax=Streptomyces sp. NPDC049906 TaxID=3155656 RepID=UPI003441A842
MRALRILLIIAVVLGGLFVAADRVAVYLAEDEAAARVRSSEGLTSTPEVSINGFPFLTQLAGGTLDEVEVTIDDYDANAGTGSGRGATPVRIEKLTATMSDVEFTGDFTSATAGRASGTALVSYPELLKAAQVEPVEPIPGVTAQVVQLSDGGDGKVAVHVELTAGGVKSKLPPVNASLVVRNGEIAVQADKLPNVGIPIPEETIRKVTDFRQRISDLPAGVELDAVEAAEDGVDLLLKGSNVRLVG